ncbi:penicillin-binding protein [Christensenellaceae bacterium OttesenSCG-928-K19]|nr:penicillin-binding protein [Christensenellaceae bacterium OttesenSCG-928-K19]
MASDPNEKNEKQGIAGFFSKIGSAFMNFIRGGEDDAESVQEREEEQQDSGVTFDALERERLERKRRREEREAARGVKEAELEKTMLVGDRHNPLKGKVAPTSKVTEETVVFRDEPVKDYKQQKLVSGETQPVPDIQGKYRIGMLFKPREKKPNLVISIILGAILIMFVVIALVVAVGFGSVIGVAKAYLETTPELDTEKIEDQSLTSYILYQDGSHLATYTGSENRDWAALEDIPEHMQNAIIAVEDVRFYDHDGVDYRRLAGAFASNLSSSSVEGGSTITQQLVKNKLLSSEKSYKRKLQEAYLAMELEENYTKEEILESYLNTIPLGGNIYGVKTAAKDYFGKELSQLTLKETVCIAAITQSTTRFNPRRATYVRTENLPYLIDRMNIITERMYWNEMITLEEYNATIIPTSEYLNMDEYFIDEKGDKNLVLADGYLEKWTREMNVLTESPANTVYDYPHFVEYVIYDVQSFLLKKNGLEDTAENRRIVDKEMRGGGYKIYATIDPTVQDAVQDTVANWGNYPSFKNASDNIAYEKDAAGNTIEVVQPQVAAAVIENDTGYLKAIVGSRTTPTSRLTLNRAKDGRLPIGSSMKPIAVYGPAFDTGYSLASGVANTKVPINGWPEDPGYPTTSSSREGPISLHDAIVYSQNIAAARTLADYVGIDTSLKYLESLGVDTSKFEANEERGTMDNRTVAGLALGIAPMNPIEVVGAYSTIPRGGEYLQPVSFNRVLDSEGNVVIDLEEERDQHQAFKETTAWQLNLALEDAVDHGTGTNANISGMTTAGKTGTVADHKGACFTGYTPYYTSCVWVGHDSTQAVFKGSEFASSVCAPLWKAYMTIIHEGLTDKENYPGEPEAYGMVQGTVCIRSNLKPGSGCSTSTDWMPSAEIPELTCDMCGGGYAIQICSETLLLATEYCPTPVESYVKTGSFPENSPYYSNYGASAPTEVCNVHTAEWYAAYAAELERIRQEEEAAQAEPTPIPPEEPVVPETP